MLNGVIIQDYPAETLVAFAVILIFVGGLLPRWVYNRVAKEAERWRLAYEAERDARNLSDAQTKELLTVTKTTKSLIQAVFDNSQRLREEGESE